MRCVDYGQGLAFDILVDHIVSNDYSNGLCRIKLVAMLVFFEVNRFLVVEF